MIDHFKQYNMINIANNKGLIIFSEYLPTIYKEIALYK